MIAVVAAIIVCAVFYGDCPVGQNVSRMEIGRIFGIYSETLDTKIRTFSSIMKSRSDSMLWENTLSFFAARSLQGACC